MHGKGKVNQPRSGPLEQPLGTRGEILFRQPECDKRRVAILYFWYRVTCPPFVQA